MAAKKRLSLIYEIQNFANNYLGKVIKFQGNGLFRFGVLSHLLGWRVNSLTCTQEVDLAYLQTRISGVGYF